MASSTQNPALKVARIYQRVSDESQDLTRQKAIVSDAIAAGYYVAEVYSEKASGARADRPELLRMIAALQPGEVVIAERMDRISRLPLEEAEKLIATIEGKGARLSVPGIVDLSEVAATADKTARLVLDAVQKMLLKITLQAARDDYETRRLRQAEGIALARRDNRYRGRKADTKRNASIIALRKTGASIAKTAKLARCSVTHVKRLMKAQQTARADLEAQAASRV